MFLHTRCYKQNLQLPPEVSLRHQYRLHLDLSHLNKFRDSGLVGCYCLSRGANPRQSDRQSRRHQNPDHCRFQLVGFGPGYFLNRFCHER